MKPIKSVLSIDWDYFFDCSYETRMMNFPDPNDSLSVNLNTMIWSLRYSDETKLEKVGITTKLYKSMLRYLMEHSHNPNYSTDLVITNSHRFLYDILTEESEVVPVNMVHIDYHHDCYNSEDTLNCGNWINHLAKHNILNKSTIHWIGRNDSEPVRNPLEIIHQEECIENTNKDLGQTITNLFNGESPDLIFLCKSCPWSPPHLDDKFDRLVQELRYTKGRLRYSNDIENRWTEQIQQSIKENREMQQSIKEIEKYANSSLV